jgi:hypothetical protein
MAEPLGETILGDREPVKNVESLVVPEYSTGEPRGGRWARGGRRGGH